MNAMSVLRQMVARDPGEPHRAATQLELFFDLVSVIALASATAAFHHAISYGHGPDLLLNFCFMIAAIWWPWVNHTWFASASDNDDAVYRIFTIVIMSGYLLFAAGATHILETMDFTYGVIGWFVMRIGMVGLWLRAAAHSPEYRAPAMIYAIGLIIAQALWVVMYFTVTPENANFIPICVGIFVVELMVPVASGLVKGVPFHRHQVIERYGLLNIIVLGEVLLSISFMFGELYDGHFDWALVSAAVAGIVIVFCIWWLYFIEPDHLNSTQAHRVFLWGYGHIAILLAGTLIAAGLGAHMDVLTDHSKIDLASANAYVGAAVAIYVRGLWAIRDHFGGFGRRGVVLPISGLTLIAAASVGAQPWTIAIILMITLGLRIKLQETQ